MSGKQLTIHMGAVSKPLKEQLDGFEFDERKVNHFQGVSDSINQLFISGYIPSSQAGRCRNKLFKNIEKHVQSFYK